MRKSSEFNLSGVSILGKEDLQEVDGGWYRLVLAHLAALASEMVYEGIEKCIEDFKKGLEQGYNN